jgi:ketopantoate hydroxymethyltransferase
LQRAFADYIEDVETKRFPAQEHIVEMNDIEWQALLKDLHDR